ncbi:MAG: hypothetical protein ACLFM3_06390 [Desulfohalobiaceae bacterium]
MGLWQANLDTATSLWRLTTVSGLQPGEEIDESSMICYLQKFSDDQLLQHLAPKLSQQEMHEILDMIYKLLKSHLSAR